LFKRQGGGKWNPGSSKSRETITIQNKNEEDKNEDDNENFGEDTPSH
jgi:hypothetical protein